MTPGKMAEEDESDDRIIEIDGNELYEHFRFVADKGQELLRVDKFLVARLQKSSRNRVQQAAEAGCILVNGKPVKSNYRVKPLDVVQVVMDRPRYEFEIIAQDIPLDIVYEDRHVLVVNKPAGLVVHPGHGNYDGTLVNALAWHFRDTPDYDVNDPRLGLVHRIDKDTSGLLMTTFPLDGPEGKRAVTHYSVTEPLGHVAVVKCVLETGRTHQIRVHMKSLGHPLFNDARYGGDQILRGVRSSSYQAFVRNCMDICPRQALHARTLGFRHPHTGEEMFFTAPVPSDMATLIDRWRTYTTCHGQ